MSGEAIGPNLNLLGSRRPDVYGSTTLTDLERLCAAWGTRLGVEVESFQSNHEGSLIDRLHAAKGTIDGLVINPGALTHTSYAIYDAIKGAGLPTVEVHLSNPDARETFRRESRVAPACLGRVAGFGAGSYALALRGLLARLAAS